MPIFLAPGVFIQETDISQVATAISPSIAAIVGASNKGPSNVRQLVTTDKQFRDLFGNPDPAVGYLHYSALAFLQDGRQLYVTRVHNGALYGGVVINSNAASTDSQVMPAGQSDPDNFSFVALTNSLFAVFAANEGVWGNNLRIKINKVNASALTFDIEVYEVQSGNEVLVESHTVSRRVQSDGFGQQLYLQDKINGNSAYIRVTDNTGVADTVLPRYSITAENIGTGDAAALTFSDTLLNIPLQRGAISVTDTSETFTDDSNGNLIGSAGGTGTVNYTTGVISVTFNVAPAGAQAITCDYTFKAEGTMTLGVNGSTLTDGVLNTGWGLYSNPDQVDVRILINGGYTSASVQGTMRDICQSRLDCIAVLDLPLLSQEPGSALTWRNNTQNINSSYTALYGPFVKIYDSTNDLTVNVPPSGFVAGVYARTDNVSDPWFPPAGPRRGLLSVLGVTRDYEKGEYELMYPEQINLVKSFPGEGVQVFGDKTQQSTESALSRVNVRRLLIILEKSMSIAAKSGLFELNTEFLRLQITQQLTSFMRTIQRRQGVTDFRVVCDETNNTAEVIDANQFNIDVYIKPSRSVNFIKLQTVVTRSGANFDELIASGAI